MGFTIRGSGGRRFRCFTVAYGFGCWVWLITAYFPEPGAGGLLKIVVVSRGHAHLVCKELHRCHISLVFT